MATNAGNQQTATSQNGQWHLQALKFTKNTAAHTAEARRIMPRKPSPANAAARHNWKSQCMSIQGRAADVKVNGSNEGTLP